MHANVLSRLTALVAAALATTTTLANFGGADDASSSSADPNAVEGRKALEAKDYAGGVRLLEQAAAADPKNADVQTWLGFAHRNLGHYDVAFKYYDQALRLSPGHRGAHEYVGEAYLQVGDLPRAEEHLAALDRICLTGCQELNELKQKIVAYKASKKK